MKTGNLDGESKPSAQQLKLKSAKWADPPRESLEPGVSLEATTDVDGQPPRMHVLFLNDATSHSILMEQELTRRGILVTDVRDLTSAEEEWNLGVHELLLVDHSVPLDIRLKLLSNPAERERPIPTMMIFEPDADGDAVSASEHGASACVFRDSEGAYIDRIATLIESRARQSNLTVTQCLPYDRDEDEMGEFDLAALAAEVGRKRADIVPAYLVVLGGPDVGRTVRLDAAPCIIGRDPTCQFCLYDQAVSRFHAVVQQLQDGVTEIKDLDSSNGIYLHGKRIKSALLKGGDEILIGKSTLIQFQR